MTREEAGRLAHALAAELALTASPPLRSVLDGLLRPSGQVYVAPDVQERLARSGEWRALVWRALEAAELDDRDQRPLLQVIFSALEDRGWTLDGKKFIDPEGNRHATLETAITVQSLREIAEAS